MNRIEIETIDPSTGKSFAELEPGGCYQLVERCVNHGWGCPKHGKARVVLERVEVLGRFESEKRDRITITLTEREASLLGGLMNGAYAAKGHRDTLFNALNTSGILFVPEAFDWSCFNMMQDYGCNAYAHAERVYAEFEGASEIRLTMDRDVSETLRHLVDRVKPMGELSYVNRKLIAAGVWLHGPHRFTGTIYWKKRRLKYHQLEHGKTYKLVNKSSWPVDCEWEEVE